MCAESRTHTAAHCDHRSGPCLSPRGMVQRLLWVAVWTICLSSPLRIAPPAHRITCGHAGRLTARTGMTLTCLRLASRAREPCPAALRAITGARAEVFRDDRGQQGLV